jgi:hypothetical protein
MTAEQSLGCDLRHGPRVQRENSVSPVAALISDLELLKRPLTPSFTSLRSM